MEAAVSLMQPTSIRERGRQMKNRRRLALMAIDGMLVILAYIGGYLIRFDFSFPNFYRDTFLETALIMLAIYYVVLLGTGQYRRIWRYVTFRDLTQLFYSLAAAAALSWGAFRLVGIMVPRSVQLITLLLTASFFTASRILYRLSWNQPSRQLLQKGTRVLIIGAGMAGEMLSGEMLTHSHLGKTPVAFLDDDESKLYRRIRGIPVLGTLKDLEKVVIEKDIEEVIFAIPTAPRAVLKEVIAQCQAMKVNIRTLPGIYELVDNRVMVSQIRDVNVLDLLGREPVEADLSIISSYVRGKKILVTGGGGSIGTELCRQIAQHEPKELAIFDVHENSLYDIQQELARQRPEVPVRGIIGDMKDDDTVRRMFAEVQPEMVYHAAAHKHVPLMEDNFREAVTNNVFGTLNVVKAAAESGTKRFVMISTDKAVNPTSIMGATKRICERIIHEYHHNGSATEFVAVRFGNVLGSNGSVIPLFRQQIAEGGPVTVTHEEIERYFMTIPEAVQLVIQAGALAKGGEIFVLDMGEPVKIMDLAEEMIRLSGFEPHVDIEIRITGLRPGEKMFEELVFDSDDYETTLHNRIFVEKTNGKNGHSVLEVLDTFRPQISGMNKEEVRVFIRMLVPEYQGWPDETQ